MSLVGDLDSGLPRVERVPPKVPGGGPAPPDVEWLVSEVAALAGLLAEVVRLAGRAAMFPGYWEALAEHAREAGHRARGAARCPGGRVVSTPHSTVTGTPGMGPCPSCSKKIGARVTPRTAPDARAWSCAGYGRRWAITMAGPRRWPGQLSGQATAVRSVLWGVVTLAEQAPELSDEQLRSRLVTLGGLVR